jgi:hypothetical protein
LLPPLLGWLVSPPVTDDEPEFELEDADELADEAELAVLDGVELAELDGVELAELDGVALASGVLVVLDVPG